jgi:membrane protein DedA with SNARE-associated domain
VERLAEEALDFLFALPETTIYLAVGILCWAEAAFFLGFVTPGEIAVATGGVLASRGQVSLAWLAMVAVTGTVAGNTTGYLLGRRWGTPLMAWGPLQRLVGPAVEKTREFMARRGEWAIVLGRLATVTRIVVPFLAGASRLSYRRFLLFDLPATAAWATTWAVLGFALGESWEVLLDVADPLRQREVRAPVDRVGLPPHVGLPASEPDSRPPPVSFSPPKAPPISAPLVPMFTLAIPQSEPRCERKVSASRMSR